STAFAVRPVRTSTPDDATSSNALATSPPFHSAFDRCGRRYDGSTSEVASVARPSGSAARRALAGAALVKAPPMSTYRFAIFTLLAYKLPSRWHLCKTFMTKGEETRPRRTRCGSRRAAAQALSGSWPELASAQLAGDVGLELLDQELLLRHHGLHDVPDRDEAAQAAGVEHGQVAHAAVGHQAHAVGHRLLGSDGHDLARHDRADAQLPRGVPVEDDLAGVVALGEDPRDRAGVGDDERPDVVLGHDLQRPEHRVVGGDRVHGGALVLQQL